MKSDLVPVKQKPFLKKAADFFFRRQDPYTEIITTNRLFGVLPIVHHFKLYYDYLVDSGVQNAVNTFLDQVVGVGFYLTADDEKALDKVELWFKEIKFKRKLKTGFKDSLITGNMMFEKMYGTNALGQNRFIDLDLVDMRIVRGIKPDEDDESIPVSVVQNLRGQEILIPYEDVIHFKLFELSRAFLGIGLYHSLAVPQYEEDGELRSTLDDMQTIRVSMTQIVKKNASPDRVFVYKDESEDVIREEGLKYKTKRQGSTHFTNKDFDYKELSVDPRSRFDRYVDLIQLNYELGTQTPAAKLQTTPGFTEASARAALELVERRIRGIQEELKSIIEEDIINPYLEQFGTDLEKANLEFHFGQPDMPDFDLEQVLKALQISVDNKPLITWEEARTMLQNSGWPLDVNETMGGDSKTDHKIKIDGVLKHVRRF